MSLIKGHHRVREWVLHYDSILKFQQVNRACNSLHNLCNFPPNPPVFCSFLWIYNMVPHPLKSSSTLFSLQQSLWERNIHCSSFTLSGSWSPQGKETFLVLPHAPWPLPFIPLQQSWTHKTRALTSRSACRSSSRLLSSAFSFSAPSSRRLEASSTSTLSGFKSERERQTAQGQRQRQGRRLWETVVD